MVDFVLDRLTKFDSATYSLGYGGFHKKRTEEFYDEGEATFYKTSRFTLVDVTTHRVADLVEKVCNIFIRRVMDIVARKATVKWFVPCMSSGIGSNRKEFALLGQISSILKSRPTTQRE